MTIILYRALAALAVLAALVGIGWMKGANHVQSKWDAANLSATVAIAKQQQKQAEVTTQVVTQYVDRWRTVHTAGQTIIKEVPVYVPATTPDLPGGFRVLHDAAATGQLPDASGSADAPPVPAQDIASTLASNYLTCRETAEQLTALQEWAKKMAGSTVMGGDPLSQAHE